MWSDRLKNSTFGFELEYADADNTKIVLPKGYQMTDNDLTRMHNSDGSACTVKGQFGGEINTRPYKYTDEDLAELQDFIKSIKDAGGYLMWNEGFDAHFYVRDLELDIIKRLFELSYWVAPYLKKIFDLPEWFENKYIAPSPDYSYVRKMWGIKDISEIPSVFANSSHRGHIRFYINFVPIVKIGTIEFRIFNSSWEWVETLETIKFMFNFVDYVLRNEDVTKYKELNTIEKCLKAFKIDRELIPLRHNPLLWASEHNNFMTLVGESFKKPKILMSKIKKVADKFNRVVLVNSFYLDVEQVLDADEIIVYVKDLFTKIIYSIILNDKKIKLKEPFDWLEMDQGSKSERLAKLFLFQQIKKTYNDDLYHKLQLGDYKHNYKKYVDKYKNTADAIIQRIESKGITLKSGDVLDAISDVERSGGLLVYQSEFNQSLRSVSNSLRFYLDDKEEVKRTPYSKVNLDNINYLVVTKMRYMGLPKILRVNRMYLYSNVDVESNNIFAGRTLKPVYYKKLPDDYQITKNSTIKFMRVSMEDVDYLRAIYLQKDILLGSAPFNYLWFVDDYLIGACMFDFTKQTSFGGEKVWMKSDFVIDSKQKKLSKLLIMAILMKDFKEELSVRYLSEVGIITTTVFSNKSVSMKYRGIFKLAKRDAGKLYYEQIAGKYRSAKEVLSIWLSKR